MLLRQSVEDVLALRWPPVGGKKISVDLAPLIYGARMNETRGNV
jgi:hypothetical protein